MQKQTEYYLTSLKPSMSPSDLLDFKTFDLNLVPAIHDLSIIKTEEIFGIRSMGKCKVEIKGRAFDSDSSSSAGGSSIAEGNENDFIA